MFKSFAIDTLLMAPWGEEEAGGKGGTMCLVVYPRF